MHNSDDEFVDFDNDMDDEYTMEDTAEDTTEDITEDAAKPAPDYDRVNADLWKDSSLSDDYSFLAPGPKRSQQTRNKTKADHAPRRKRVSRSFNILTVILSLTTLCSLGLCLYMLIHPRTEPTGSNSIIEGNSETPAFYSQEEVDMMMEEAALAHEQELKNEIMNQLSVENPSVTDTLRWLYSDSILYLDSDGYHFIPISDSIEHNTLERSGFSVSENGDISYTAQDGRSAAKGIDVSQHQGDIDWEQVAGSGVEFAMIRAGIRGYESGALVTDSYFETNMEGASANGIETGVYFFTQAVTVDEALEEARYVLELVAPYDLSYPIAIDVENPSASARANSLTQAQRTEIVSAFCDAIAEAGYTPMIYGNTYSLFGMLDIEQINHYAIWHAFYNNYVYYPYQIQMWQYTSQAGIPGIEGNVDLNLWFRE